MLKKLLNNKKKPPKEEQLTGGWADSDNIEGRTQWADKEIAEVLKKYNCTLFIEHNIKIIPLPKADELKEIDKALRPPM